MYETFDFTKSVAAALESREAALDVKLHDLEPDHLLIKQSAFEKILKRADTAGFRRGFSRGYPSGLEEGRLEEQIIAFEKGQVEGLAKGRRLGPENLRDRVNMLRRWKSAIEVYEPTHTRECRDLLRIRITDLLNLLRRMQ